ncbi:MAG: hypothetical protein WAU89_18440 [Candidatus Acidiferrales bacterium]
MSNYKTHCSQCGAMLSNRFCSACGADSEQPLRRRFLAWFSWMRQYPRFAFWLILLLIGGIVATVDENVDFFEKHAPKLNAAFHSGEITTSGDADYNIQKWLDDKGKLDDDPKGPGWVAMRDDLLGRQIYLDDMVSRNETFQRRVTIEVTNRISENDACQNLTVHEAAPLIAQATQAERAFYAWVKRTKTPTAEDEALLARFSDEKDQIDKRFVDFHSHWQASGCK